MIRVYTTHEPLKVFLSTGVVFLLAAVLLFVRFIVYFLMGEGGGHVQSLIFGAVLFLFAGFFATVGILADLINANRRLIEEVLKRVRDRSPDAD
jgi:hypothetical protein